MKFWEWEIFITGLLCVLSADSSIAWCAVLAIACLFGIIMQQFQAKVEEETRRSIAMKRASSGDDETDSWVRHVDIEDAYSNYNTTIWDEYQ